MTGGSSTVPGVNVPYEAPEHPVAVVDTEKESQEEACAEAINALMKWVDEHGG
jgi:adenylylsulfate kinase